MKSVLFIHRSVGQNLLDDGGLNYAVQSESSMAGIKVNFSDINNNNNKKVPGQDTKPKDYLKYFSKIRCEADLVVIKSCYPNSSIKSTTDLAELKKIYKDLIKKYLENSPGKMLLLTTPPLRPISTNGFEAKRARLLSDWLSSQKFGQRVRVFNFFDLLAEPINSTNPSTLKKEYRRCLPWDNHPNKLASRTIAPILSKEIVNFIK